jgi:tRNA threonylcarbamoyladenosine biosynthesis protein TsaB
VLVAAIDSATLTLSCALLEVGADGVELITDATEQAPRASAGASGGHGARLPVALTQLLVAHGRRLPDVEGYAVGLGPGSFTGLRIGLATFKGLAYANRRPIAGVSSLAAMALGAARQAGVGPASLLVPLLDAKKGEVYAGFYRVAEDGAGVTAVHPDAALAPAALLSLLATPELTGGAGDALEPLGFGEGFLAFEPTLAPRLTQLATEVRTPPASAVGALAAAALRQATFDVPRLSALEPHYVRASEAEVKFPDGIPAVKP